MHLANNDIGTVVVVPPMKNTRSRITTDTTVYRCGTERECMVPRYGAIFQRHNNVLVNKLRYVVIHKLRSYDLVDGGCGTGNFFQMNQSFLPVFITVFDMSDLCLSLTWLSSMKHFLSLIHCKIKTSSELIYNVIDSLLKT